MIYDVGIDALHRAIRAIDGGNIQARVAASNKFFAVLGELRAALNYERGGDVARQLGRVYEVARVEILRANIQIDRATFEKYAGLFSQLRESWRQVEREVPGTNSAPASAPVRTIAAPPPEPAPSGSNWSA
jgi:flagellar secretion chaperone FliS